MLFIEQRKISSILCLLKFLCVLDFAKFFFCINWYDYVYIYMDIDRDIDINFFLIHWIAMIRFQKVN